MKFDSDCRFVGVERLRSIVAKLHENSIMTIIGDFGSGSDSIGFLASEPVDAVSINERFTHTLASDARAGNTLEHLTRMASAYVDRINIKGVDTPRLRDFVKTLPVTSMQGAYYSAPLSVDALMEKYFGQPSRSEEGYWLGVFPHRQSDPRRTGSADRGIGGRHGGLCLCLRSRGDHNGTESVSGGR